jgi:hypothetical protein
VEPKQPNQNTFQAARDQERIIAEGLWSIRPQDRNWDKIVYTRNTTGGTSSSIAFIHSGQDVKRAGTSPAVSYAADDLREVMYQPDKGAWLSMTLTITPAGDGWGSTYNYTEKPVWELGEPSGDDYAQELYVYPRDEEHIPDWFRDELKTAVWTPPAK